MDSGGGGGRGPQCRDRGADDRLAELRGDLLPQNHPLQDEGPDEHRHEHLEVDVHADLAAQLGQLQHGEQGPPLLRVHPVDDRLQLLVLLAGGQKGTQDVREAARLLEGTPLVEDLAEVLFEIAVVGRGLLGVAGHGRGDDHRRLRAEVPVEGGLRHTGAGRHLFEGHAGHAVLEHDVDGRHIPLASVTA